jgi:hypothetical protein
MVGHKDVKPPLAHGSNVLLYRTIGRKRFSLSPEQTRDVGLKKDLILIVSQLQPESRCSPFDGAGAILDRGNHLNALALHDPELVSVMCERQPPGGLRIPRNQASSPD